ncbi:hypothetical protein [Solemya velesiana gill symbiont]|uniref:Phage tail tape measure protein n=1 Tax=Solemya velesiana gill symbiont TaxID=1918948 RepID=A0A1T2KX66_9GAMM|nr:hypothetical protein [Solemya velesiana gill symbiont]OOZ37449.1 hypothetical protein BOW51_02590 [Solemya velesiana gill symbiont]
MPLQLNNDNLTVALVLKAKNLVSKGVNEAKGDIKDLGKTAKKSAKDIEAAYKNLGIRSRREIDREIRKMEASYKRLQRSGKLSADEQKRAYKALKGQIKALRDESRGASKEIKGMAGEVNALGGLLTGAAIVAGVRSIVDAGLEMERIKQSLKAAVGNDRFAEEMKFVRAEADRGAEDPRHLQGRDRGQCGNGPQRCGYLRCHPRR